MGGEATPAPQMRTAASMADAFASPMDEGLSISPELPSDAEAEESPVVLPTEPFVAENPATIRASTATGLPAFRIQAIPIKANTTTGKV